MNPTLAAKAEGYKMFNITAGDYYASRDRAQIRTVLGSCIAVCLRDPVTQIGGMNHFMLAGDSHDSAGSARYGIHAMELLINSMMKLGADRRNFEAKVFGGGHVMQDMHSAYTVPTGNIKFAKEFLATEGIPIASIDVGGNEARRVIFHTDTGRTLLSRIACKRMQDDPELAKLRRRVTDIAPAPQPPSAAGDITLF